MPTARVDIDVVQLANKLRNDPRGTVAIRQAAEVLGALYDETKSSRLFLRPNGIGKALNAREFDLAAITYGKNRVICDHLGLFREYQLAQPGVTDESGADKRLCRVS